MLNRNPKHRLGATRDAAELKEHAFFKNIDWELLAQRAIPPPFKPYVDSDESVANFDPEFTEANLLDEAPHDVEFDESDPSERWLDKASELGRSQVDHKAAPMEIRTNTRSSRPPVQPLTNSVQENFRMFSSPSMQSVIFSALTLARFEHYRWIHFFGRRRINDSSRRRIFRKISNDGRFF